MITLALDTAEWRTRNEVQVGGSWGWGGGSSQENEAGEFVQLHTAL